MGAFGPERAPETWSATIRVNIAHKVQPKEWLYPGQNPDCETKEGMIDRIERDLEFSGPLGSEQRSKLQEIAEKCPVHHTLVSEINIRTRVL